MKTFRILDSKGRVLHQCGDHVESRQAFQGFVTAMKIVDENGVVFGAKFLPRDKNAPKVQNDRGRRVWLSLTLPKTVVERLKTEAANKCHGISTIVETAIREQQMPSGELVAEDLQLVKVTVPAVLRDHLERQAVQTGGAIEVIGELAVRGWFESVSKEAA